MLKARHFMIFFLFIFGCAIIDDKGNIEINKKSKMKNISLKDKIAQMIMIRVDGKYYNKNYWREEHINSLIVDYKIGGVITYGGSVHGTFHRLKTFQNLSNIPLFVAADYERGLGTFMDGTLFPPNMAIAATQNEDFSYMQGKYIAREAKRLGVNMIFAPVLDINNNLNNPIINIRSYGDTPETVIKYGMPFIKGIQEESLIACAKHYPGHGNTGIDSHTSLPIIDITINELYNNELAPFKSACEIGVKSIMTGHIMIPEMDNLLPATFSKIITDDILRKEWSYNGLIVTDALEMGALTSTTWHGESAIRAIEGGADIILLPLDGIKAIESIYSAVKEGRLTEERINFSFNRIIKSKEDINLFNVKSKLLWDDLEEVISNPEHKKIASKIAEKSITLIKNNKSLIPFKPNEYKKISHILLSTDNDLRTRLKSYAYDIKYTSGNVNEIYINDPLSDLAIQDVINKIEGSDIIIVSMLIRISMNKGLSTIHETHAELLNELKKKDIPTIGVSFGSPYLPNYNSLDTYMASYGYGSISLSAASDALFGRKDIGGKLPVTLNNDYKIGHGIVVKKNSKIFKVTNNIKLEKTISVIEKAISDSIFPGAQIFVSKENEIFLNEGFGNFTYDTNSNKVDKESIYDIASLTKVLSATPVVMKLLQRKRIGLDYPLYHFYPEFSIGEKKELTIRHLLTHTSGLPAYIEYYKRKNIDNKVKMIEDIVSLELVYEPDQKVIYSDLGMILLLDIIERITDKGLDELSSKYFYSPLKMKNTFFNPDISLKNRIVPTEYDDYFRNTLLQGKVHDENAFILNGVSTHAGLFSNAYDIGILSQMLLDDGIHLGRRYLKKNIINKFTSRYNVPKGSDRTIGWDTPSQNGKSSAGDYFSDKSFGHLGFTGTSLWIDPKKDIIVVLLTNRVYPKRGNKNEMYNFRRKFHNTLMKEIGN